MARPTIMKPDVVAKLEEAFLLGCSDKEACLMAGIAPATLYKYQDRTPAFVERKDLLKSHPVLLARQTVVKHIQRDADLALKFLERRAKDEFSTRTEIEHSGDVGLFGSDALTIKVVDGRIDSEPQAADSV